MLKWLTSLWVVICVVGLPVSARSGQDIRKPTKQTSLPIKKIERLTVQRLPKTAVRKEEQSTLESRRRVALDTENLLRKSGISSDKMIIAVLANAWHESRWNPREDDGLCVGLFQLHVWYTGKGSTREQLKDPTHNTKKLMATSDFKKWLQWCENHPKESCGSISFRFASQVERCATRYRYPRIYTADKWYMSLSKV